MVKNTGVKLIAQNKKAYHEYFIEETFQAGIELIGTEVKSLRQGKCNLKDSFVKIENNEAFVYNMHISPYEHGNIFNKDPLRKRRLLLHKKEINKLMGAVALDGFTIVPTRIYILKSLVKIDIAIARGKKLYDKRETIAKKDVKRQAEKEFKIRNLQ
ncbi:SsrA-binding protein SmpB [Anaeropeptidivorans aminofermentans]|jgi:SsrA-binding protein|uniref:SsrA-binding protein SmpB n=1 Tax=Anaeropeptidivorans aminofermentans TaxID=2934315 RepID=UPI0020258142|nr:SsrA-binding protein SmpB [Anaeropeptidivorans aminofermentans]MBE6011543.1 SsrA-binding protein SmpB [Lachnospiraceae bacterium]